MKDISSNDRTQIIHPTKILDIMKITLFLSSVYAANAFIAPQFAVRSSTQLFDRVDSSEAVEAALKASKEFGPTSKEARVAWDIVEEMDSSDNR